MTKPEALKLQQKIQDLCTKYSLWVDVVHILKPDLKMIKIKEISIKIDK